MENTFLNDGISQQVNDKNVETGDGTKSIIEVIDIEKQRETEDKHELGDDLPVYYQKYPIPDLYRQLDGEDDDVISLKEEDPLLLPVRSLGIARVSPDVETSLGNSDDASLQSSSPAVTTSIRISAPTIVVSSQLSTPALAQNSTFSSASSSSQPVISNISDITASSNVSIFTSSYQSAISLSSSSPSTNDSANLDENSLSKNVVPLDMMPTIPLIPVQVPGGHGGSITLGGGKVRGRQRCFSSTISSLRPGLGITIKRGGKVKRLTSNVVRGARRLVHSMSLDDKGILGLRDESYLDDEISCSQDDMFLMPTIHEKWPDKTCAFCCLSEKSQLGQGELNQYEATPGFNLTEKAHFTEDVLREASASKKLSLKMSNIKSKLNCSKSNLLEHTDEMTIIGHTERPNLAVLFTTNGQCFAHYMCALWSNGVELASDDTIACVDKAVVSASERKCFYCKRLGASIKCNVLDCQIWYHFPCATTVGALIDFKSVAMVCPSHSTKARDYLVDMACMVCDSNSPESSLLFCCTCGNHYHGFCLKPPLTVTSIIRTGWQCSDCKICQSCREPADEIICIVCDKSYHLVCARPQGLSITRKDWKCKACRLCGDCGSRVPGTGLSSRWHLNYSVCDSCFQLRSKGFACPICKKSYKAIMQKNLAQCSVCKRHVHSLCDVEADLDIIHAKWLSDRSHEFTCSVCKTNPLSSRLSSLRSPEREESMDLHDSSLLSEDSNDVDTNTASEDSLTSPAKSYSTVVSVQSTSGLAFGGSSSSTSVSSTLGLSALQNPNLFERTGSTGSNISFNSRGKPFGLARRGASSMLFSRMRGTVSNKGTSGKKGVNSGRKRGAQPAFASGRKGRGCTGGGTASRGYRGYFNYQQVNLQSMEANQTTTKEEGEENKLLLINANDKYSMWQDVCAMCGAFGQDQEGRLVACSQCGQCFHPFCANVKVNRVVLEKGWRCLDCTVCEGCGERNDEARLVLCEDCDISCHIYCMTPPLEHVPAGIWKCKWCAVCQYCGATCPGNNSTWMQNYSMCGPCFSMTTCPVCDESYSDSELIIQCSSCDRWLHASDDSIHTEDDAEKCIEKGYLCLICRDPESLPPHLLPPSPQPVKHSSSIKTSGGGSNSFSQSAGLNTSSSSIVSPARSESPLDFMSKLNQNAEHWMDGTCLSESGLHQIQTMSLQSRTTMKKARNVNVKGMRTSRGLSIDSTGSRDLDDDDDDDDYKMDCIPAQMHWVHGMKEGTILNAKDHGDPPILPDKFYTIAGVEPGTFILRKRRLRNIKTVGIGGFQVRARAKRDEEKAREEAEMNPQQLELRRKRTQWRSKKKIKILEKFPSYIQEAFFGRNLMDTSNIKEENGDMHAKPVEEPYTAAKIQPCIRLSQDEVELVHAAKEKHEQDKKRKLDAFVQSTDDPQTKIGPVKNPSLGSSSQIKTEDKKIKEEKLEDIVEDDENDYAIEALFGAEGSALISDDLVLDIMNDEMKDVDASFNEDKDQIDEQTNVDDTESKLTDLLGPGFDLQDVDDIMKNLREDAHNDPTPRSSDVQRNVPSAPRVVVPPAVAQTNVANTDSVVTNSSITTISNHPISALQLPNDSPNVAVLQPPTPVPSLQMARPLNQPTMAPLAASISELINVRQQLPGVSAPFQQHIKTNNMASMPSPGITTYQNPENALPSFGIGHTHPMQQRIVSPIVNALHVAQQQHIVKPAGGNILTQQVRQSGVQIVKAVQLRGLPDQHATQLHQKIPLSHNSPLSGPSTPTAGPVSQVAQQQNSPRVQGAIGRPHQNAVHQPTPSYPHHYGSNEQTPNISHTEVVTKPSGTSESQSLSLTLEEDEALGDKATKAAVLYTNIHKPTLKAEFALHTDRDRQIKRTWKGLNAEQRKIYAQKARENKKEYFKNKQEHQRAVRTQEKEAAAVKAAAPSEEANNSVVSVPSRISTNVTYQQQPNVHQRGQITLYAQTPTASRPHDDGNIMPQTSPQGGLVQHSEVPQLINWEDSNSLSPGIPQPQSSPTRPIGQFRQPLPPMGSNQQIRMRVPVQSPGASIVDPRMRLIQQQHRQQLQQMHQQPQLQSPLQQPQQQLHLQAQSSQQQQIQSQQQQMQSQQQQMQSQQQQMQSHQHQIQSQQQIQAQQMLQHKQHPLQLSRPSQPQMQQVMHNVQQQQHPQMHHQQNLKEMQDVVIQQNAPPRMQQYQLLIQNNSKMSHVMTTGQGTTISSEQLPSTSHISQPGNNLVSELPESVTRELEQLEKEHQNNHADKTASRIRDLENDGSGDLSQIEDELLCKNLLLLILMVEVK